MTFYFYMTIYILSYLHDPVKFRCKLFYYFWIVKVNYQEFAGVSNEHGRPSSISGKTDRELPRLQYLRTCRDLQLPTRSARRVQPAAFDSRDSARHFPMSSASCLLPSDLSVTNFLPSSSDTNPTALISSPDAFA